MISARYDILHVWIEANKENFYQNILFGKIIWAIPHVWIQANKESFTKIYAK